MAKAKKYRLLVPAAGLPAGAVISGPAVDVLVANGKAAEIIDATDAIPPVKKDKDKEGE